MIFLSRLSFRGCYRYLTLTAVNKLKQKVAVKQINANEALDFLHVFGYDYDNLCAHLKIQDDSIDIELSDLKAQVKGLRNIMENNIYL